MKIVKENQPVHSRAIIHMSTIDKNILYNKIRNLIESEFIKKIPLEEVKEKYPKTYEKYENIRNFRSSVKYYFCVTKTGSKWLEKQIKQK